MPVVWTFSHLHRGTVQPVIFAFLGRARPYGPYISSRCFASGCPHPKHRNFASSMSRPLEVGVLMRLTYLPRELSRSMAGGVGTLVENTPVLL